MRDFTLEQYRHLLEALKGYGELTLRHDVDKKPQNSLATAIMEAELGFKAIYYFRAVPESWDERIILQIHELGHEIGYHYESLTTCNGNIDAAYEDFCKNLRLLETLLGKPVRTICMHGSPRSPWDSKEIWKKYDYHALGIEYEPYLDTDFCQTFYITDTGRRWDGEKFSVRDKVAHSSNWPSYHSTEDIIRAIQEGSLPKRLMITTHPQRWSDNKMAWLEELIMQNIKNIIKSFIVKS